MSGVRPGRQPRRRPNAMTFTKRVDPYWDEVWGADTATAWIGVGLARQQYEQGGFGLPRGLLIVDPREAWEAMVSPDGWSERLAALSFLDAWRTASLEQLAAFTGVGGFGDLVNGRLAPLFSTGLIEVGVVTHPFARRSERSRRVYVRPATVPSFARQLRSSMTYEEWVSVTGGLGWVGGSGQYERHNILATELGLRAAEMLDVGAVLGEKFATVDLLGGSGLGRTVDLGDNKRGDAVLVRADGLRVVVEMTAKSSASFERKVFKWASLLSKRPLETSGLVVLFVGAPKKQGPRGGTSYNSSVYAKVSKVLQEFPGVSEDSPARRIGVAEWESFFPAPGRVDLDRFGSLACRFALGRHGSDERWVDGSMMSVGFRPFTRMGFDPLAVVGNAKVLGASPWWLRVGDHSGVVDRPSVRRGVVVPVPSRVGGGVWSGGLGEGRGVVGDAVLPDRLRVVSR